jgi:Ca-activated chloride channel family protein
MSFLYPWAFALIFIVVPILVLGFRKGMSGKSLRYPLSFRSIPWQSTRLEWRTIVRFTLRLLAGLFLITALARPQNSDSQIKRSSEGIDIVITLDVSKSMEIEDYGERNRLMLAKSTIEKFIDGRKDDRIGLVQFSGEAVTLCPPTLDYVVLQEALARANTDMLKDGTAIGDAIANSINRLKDSTAKSKIIILVTDGDSNVGSIAPLTAGSLAQGYGVKVYSIAMGTEGTVRMPVYENFFGRVVKNYQQVTSSINPELLQKISKETGGKFYRASAIGDLDEIFSAIDKLERSAIVRKESIRWHEEFARFLLPALALLVLEFLLGQTILRILPN